MLGKKKELMMDDLIFQISMFEKGEQIKPELGKKKNKIQNSD